jgi:hypothetical protein
MIHETGCRRCRAKSRRTPLAGSYFAVQNRYAGGDDQYVAGPTASPSASGRTPLAGVIGEFDFASQGG